MEKFFRKCLKFFRLLGYRRRILLMAASSVIAAISVISTTIVEVNKR